MKQKKFGDRLRTCLAKGRMTQADLATWLDRPQPTVNTWLKGDRIPWGPGRQDAMQRIAVLEALIAKKTGMPIPATLSVRKRKPWVERLKHAHLDSSVFAPDPAN